jgi:MoxR-like ATPase
MAKKPLSTNFTQLKPSQLVNYLKIQTLAKNTTMIWGAPGIGKSSLVADFAKSITGMRNGKPVKYNLVDIRLAQMEPTDLRGIPIPVHEKAQYSEVEIKDKEIAQQFNIKQNTKVLVKWAEPVFWPTAQDDPTVIFLDEMNSAPPTIQAAAYQILLDRGIGEIRFPEDTIIIAAGNRETDRGVTFQLPTPVRNRMSHVELVFDFEEWRVIATEKDYSPLVIGYL